MTEKSIALIEKIRVRQGRKRACGSENLGDPMEVEREGEGPDVWDDGSGGVGGEEDTCVECLDVISKGDEQWAEEAEWEEAGNEAGVHEEMCTQEVIVTSEDLADLEYGGEVLTEMAMGGLSLEDEEGGAEEEEDEDEEGVTEEDRVRAHAVAAGHGPRTKLMVLGKEHPGGLTLEEACAQEMLTYVNGKMSKAACNQHLERVYFYMGGAPEATNFPRSLYFLKKIIGGADAWDFSIHYCPNKCRCFRNNDHKPLPTPKEEWASLSDTVCGEPVRDKHGRVMKDASGEVKLCEGKRFSTVTHSSTKVSLTPKAYFFYFGVKNIIQRRFRTDMEFCKGRATYEARAKENGDVWSAELVKYIDGMVENQLLAEECVVDNADERKKVFKRKGGLYEMGYDHAQPFKRDKNQHSTGFMYIKLADTRPWVSTLQ
jgi:hypothetical protein